MNHQTQPEKSGDIQNTSTDELRKAGDAEEEQKRRAAERLQKLRNLSFNLNAGDPNNEFDSVPAYIRRYPFVLANDESQQRMIVCIERPAEIFREEGADMPLFDDKGEPSEYTQNAIKFCEDFETERRRTEQFVNLITELDLWETKRAMFTPNLPNGQQGEPQLIADYFGIAEEKLRAIPADKLVELRDSGALEKIYNHLSSLVGWDRLIAIASAKQARTGPIAANIQ